VLALTTALSKPPTDLCSFMYTEFTNYLPSLGREGLNEMYDDVRKQLELEKKLRKVRVIGILLTRKNFTSCNKFVNKPSTSCFRTACHKLSTVLEQLVDNL
jgi:hypothetical protein